MDRLPPSARRPLAAGVFPEGGSHDRTSLLPFKSGCAVFALGCAPPSPAGDQGKASERVLQLQECALSGWCGCNPEPLAVCRPPRIPPPPGERPFGGFAA